MDEKGRCSLLLFTFLLIFYTSLLPFLVFSQCNRSPVIFNFGDSNSDTGGYAAGLGINYGFPEGRIFFHASTGRLCDGRLVIDFLCESLNTTYLTPYLESLEPNFSNGANFAISGSSTLPRSIPFSLHIQVLQFIRFRNRSIDLVSKGVRNLAGEDDFNNALYRIDIGQNDLAAAFSGHPSYPEVLDKIPSFISEIKDAIWTIYLHGGKNFWVHNTGPLGCLPQELATTTSKNQGAFDQFGCLQSLNEGAQVFNSKLSALCDELRSEMKSAGGTIVYVDTYSIKYDLIANSAKYGFESPLMACCGYGGPPYNYNSTIKCGSPRYGICKEGSHYISWDGVHYTEAANSIVTSKILSTAYSTPAIKFNHFCNT